VRSPPPGLAAPSSTRTDFLAAASVIAAARPFGPEPTTTASYRSPTSLVEHSRRAWGVHHASLAPAVRSRSPAVFRPGLQGGRGRAAPRVQPRCPRVL